MAKKKKRVFSPEFKAQSCGPVPCRRPYRLSQVAVDLGLVDSVLRNWIRQADVSGHNEPSGALDSAEKAELARLRKDNKRLPSGTPWLASGRKPQS